MATRTTGNATPRRRGRFWGYYREERGPIHRLRERKTAYGAKSVPAESGCSRLIRVGLWYRCGTVRLRRRDLARIEMVQISSALATESET